MENFNIQEELKKLPGKPGVYLMHDEKDAIIYVGKAISLKNRVRQYFQSSRNKGAKIEQMVTHITRFEYIITDSELEALVLECNLIKEHRPKYNTMLKDDKTYPYLKVTVNEEYPRVLFVRRMKKDKAKYFGPYTSSNAVKDSMELIRKLYHVRTCNRNLPRDIGKDRPCLYYHIKQCKAPCQGYISKEEYQKQIEGVLDFLNGDYKKLLKELEEKINVNTRAVIINTPHNPTGVVYSEETIKELAAILEKKQQEFGSVIYLISDEPYRELAYDGVEVPYLTKYYDNTIVGYSYSKSLSLPGERIGYLVIPDEADGSEELITAAAIANRTIGCVNAPSLMQKVIAKCVDAEVDVAAYDKNRLALYNGLKECGFECIKPQGAFYLFVKSPIADEKAFCEAGKKYNILMVPGSSFACPGYVRLAYCVSYDTIINSLPEFKKLAEEFGL